MCRVENKLCKKKMTEIYEYKMNTNCHYYYKVFAAKMPLCLARRATYFSKFKVCSWNFLRPLLHWGEKKCYLCYCPIGSPVFYHCTHMNIAEGSNASSSHCPINSKAKYPNNSKRACKKNRSLPSFRLGGEKVVHFVIQALDLTGIFSGFYLFRKAEYFVPFHNCIDK